MQLLVTSLESRDTPSDFSLDHILVDYTQGTTNLVDKVYNPNYLGFGIYKASLNTGETPEQAVTRYSQIPGVKFAELDKMVSMSRVPNDPNITNGVQADKFRMNAPQAWDSVTGTKQTIVAVVDSGVDYNHQDLAGNIWHNTKEIAGNGVDDDGNGYVDDTVGYDFINRDNDPNDDNRHGTHVAGILGAVGNNGIGVAGVSWNTQIMPLKFLNSQGQGYASAAIEAWNYAANNGAKIINNSWTGGYDPSLQSAADAMRAKGVILVNAAGNDNTSNPEYPAALPEDNVISVGAIDNNGYRANFSNYGPTVDLFAPGVNIASTLPGNTYGFLSGTSMASPQVAGALSLIWDYHPTWTYSQVINNLISSAKSTSALNGDKELDIGAAFSTSPAPTPPPTTPTTPASVTFVGTDKTTQGRWVGKYGKDGSNIAGVANTIPSYVQNTPVNFNTNVYARNNGDLRALQYNGNNTIVSDWTGKATSFDMINKVTDGQTHNVSLYFADWYEKGRIQTVDVIDGDTGNVLDTQSVSNFQGSSYYTWTVGGNVKFRVTAQYNGFKVPTIAAVFFDPASSNTNPTPSPPTTPSPGNSATFVGTDDTTLGRWVGKYGAEGNNIASINNQNAPYAQFTPVNFSTNVYARNNGDGRGLQFANGTQTTVSDWTNPNVLNVISNVVDGNKHNVSLYFADWFEYGRSQQIEVIDGDTNQVLDSKTISSFQGSRYYTWTLKGNITFRITALNGRPATLSGAFFDSAT